jgi:Uma2 family endonuclease
MTTATQTIIPASPPQERLPPLCAGDRLTPEEFERRYDAMPHLKKAELIDGVVYMAPPVSFEDHAAPHFDTITWLGLYRIATPGVRGGDNGTLRLPLKNRPQPDGFLIVLPSHGGQAKIDKDGYVVGAPELIVEIAATNASYDLHDKLEVYRRNDAKEYVVWRVFDKEFDWFVLRSGKYEQAPLPADGIYRSEVLPGLWLDPAALAAGDMVRVAEVSRQGTAGPEHAAFVAKLQQVARTASGG